MAIALAVAVYATDGHLLWRCPFLLLTHVPCPGCGGVRSVAALFHGDIAGALYWNATAVVLVFLGAAFSLLAIADLMFGARRAFKLYTLLRTKRFVYAAWAISAMLLTYTWWHNIVAIAY